MASLRKVAGQLRLKVVLQIFSLNHLLVGANLCYQVLVANVNRRQFFLPWVATLKRIFSFSII